MPGRMIKTSPNLSEKPEISIFSGVGENLRVTLLDVNRNQKHRKPITALAATNNHIACMEDLSPDSAEGTNPDFFMLVISWLLFVKAGEECTPTKANLSQVETQPFGRCLYNHLEMLSLCTGLAVIRD